MWDGYLSSQQVVGWYNADPDMRDVQIPLDSVKHVAVIGAGNVALDIGRILLKPPKLLEETNIVRTALEQLRKSTVEQVTIIARRGAVHAAFSTKELRELCQVKILGCIVICIWARKRFCLDLIAFSKKTLSCFD